MKNYEKELPSGYTQALHINALDKKLGLVLNLAALAILAVVVLVGLIPIFIGEPIEYDSIMSLIASTAFVVAMVLYMLLHELVHGVAYKILTKEKLSFGISWSCAWCGVPNIYVYRRASLIALVAPLITFTALLLPLTVLLYFVSFYAYIVSLAILATHLGGCIGDIYMTFLLLTRFKDDAILVRDTGPEQYIYIPDKENIKEG